MSQMGDSAMGELKGMFELAVSILNALLDILMKLENQHHERVMKDKSLTHKAAGVAAVAIGSAAKSGYNLIKRKVLSGEIDLKAFTKLQKNTEFKYMTFPTSKISELSKSCKKAGIPIFVAENGNNISAVAIPAEHMHTVDNMLKFMLSKDMSRDQGMEFFHNTEFQEIDNKIFHNIINSYEIPTISFNKADGTELIAVPNEYKEQYLDVVAETKETIRDISNIEISDGFVWGDLNTTAIEVTPLQAAELDENYKNVKICDIDGKIYAYGAEIEKEVNEVKNKDEIIEKNADEWQIGIIDNTITLNKNALIGREEKDTQLIKIPGEKDHYIRFDKSELSDKDGGKTLTSKLDYDKEYEICDSEGGIIEKRKGEKLASVFDTRSPFNKLINDSTDKEEYRPHIDRVELFNEKTNKLISLPIGSMEDMTGIIKVKTGLDDKTAERMAMRISENLSDDYKQNFGYNGMKRKEYTVSRNTINSVKAAVMSQKLNGYVCKNGNNQTTDKEVYAIIDKRSREYVYVEKEHWYQLDDKLKEMGYGSIEREAIISKLIQTYDINNTKSSIKYEQKLTTVSPVLKNVHTADFGNGSLTIYNVDPEKMKFNYVVVDKDVSTLDFEQLCRDKLEINDDAAIAELIEKNVERIKEPTVIAVERIGGNKYNISQLTSKYIQISDGKKSIIANKNTLNSERVAQKLEISEKDSDKLVKSIRASFKAKEHSDKKIMPIGKLKAEAAKAIELQKNVERTIGEKGQFISEKTHTSERTM